MQQLLVLVLLGVLFCVNGQLDPRWKLVWSDEFNGDALDTTKWTARDQEGYTNNGELEWNSPEQVYVSNGTLIIKSNPNTTHSGFKYASGYLDTSGKWSATFGRYEIHAQLPIGKGMWPAHWLLSQYLCWPVGAEIDIMESISKPISQIYGTYHFGACCGCNTGNGSMYDSHIDLSKSFHTYAVEWNKTSVTWFFDNVAYKTVDSASVNNGKNFTFDVTPHYFILNTAVGGSWPGDPDNTTTWPQYHIIDYVRMYGWEPCSTGCNHGCCETAIQTCKCDGGYQGTFCEYTNGVSYNTKFASETSNDILIGNAAIANNLLTLTVTNTSCPGGCSGQPEKGGSWQTHLTYGQGNFSFAVKASSVSGTGLLLWGTSSGGSFEGFQVGISGSSPTKVALQIFGPGSGYQQFDLGFDASQDYHEYLVSYTSVFKLFVDGKFIGASSAATSSTLQIQIQYEYSTQYYGPWSATPPVHAYAISTSWITANSAKAVCSVPATKRARLA
jgi:beta-glucanase (GH16 family)